MKKYEGLREVGWDCVNKDCEQSGLKQLTEYIKMGEVDTSEQRGLADFFDYDYYTEDK